MKYAFPISIVFLACSLAGFFLDRSLAAVALFGIAASLTALVCYLERKRSDGLAELEVQMKDLRTHVSDLAFKLGYGG